MFQIVLSEMSLTPQKVRNFTHFSPTIVKIQIT